MSAVAINSDVGGSVVNITDLHDDLKERILVRLPLADAIRTSELSSEWRSSWTRMRCVRFVESFFKSMGDLNDARFARIIERVLLLHQGLICQFIIDIPDHIISPICLNGLFINLSRKQVKYLAICSKKDDPVFLIPSYLFDCLELKDLHLETCFLKLPSKFQGFHNLVSLHLDLVNISSKELGEIISRCPCLETLSFIDIFSPFSEPLDLIAPNVRRLDITDYISGIVNLKNTSNLTVVAYKWLERYHVQHKLIHSSIELLCCLSRVEELEFDLFLLEPLNGDFPNIVEKELASLKTLTLGHVNISVRDDMFFTFCLLRSSPNLKTLNISMHHIKTSDEADEVSVEWLKAEEKKGYNLSQLVSVKISGITGSRCETMLVKTMLTRCALLETFLIEPHKDIKNEAEKKMAWELNRCRRLSRDVELVYSSS